MKPTYFHISKFLRNNKYRLTLSDFYKQFSSHPDYPSLYAITDTFKHLGIENIAAKIPKEEFDNLPDNFLAVIKENEQQNIVYVKKSSENITYLLERQKKKVSKDVFLDIWEEIIIAIETNSETKTSEQLPENKLLYAFLAVSVLSGIGYFIFSNPNLIAIAYFLTTLIGLAISILIAREDLGIYSDVVSKICDSSSKTSCNEVISSKGAKIMSYASLSDLCIIFFSSIILICLFLPAYFSNVILFSISAISILFSLYSLYYQAFVIKKWCVLCLGITSILAIQFLLVAFSTNHPFNWEYLLAIILCFSITFPLWARVKNNLVQLKKFESAEIEFLKLKRNKKIFKTVLEKEKKVSQDELENLYPIHIGNPTAKEMIYAILSPSCGHCIKAFKDYSELVNNNPEGVQVGFLFNVNPENRDNDYLKVAHTIVHIFINEGNEKALLAMKDWYDSEFDLISWNQKHSTESDEQTKKILSTQNDWCMKNEINYTPATIYRFHIYPLEFYLSDLKFFIGEDY